MILFNSKLLYVLIGVFPFLVNAQTVGTLLNTPAALNGYTLLSPLNDSSTYLINNCGELMHKWETSYLPGNHAELDDEGNLYRSGEDESPYLFAGGQGGVLEKYDWDNNLLWSYTLSNSTERLHHDFTVLPNGNILAIVWEKKDAVSAENAGRDPERTVEDEVWTDRIVELQPIGTSGALIVWEWDFWDHLIQDFDETKENFGSVGANPRKLNVNSGGLQADWLHCNAIDYNEQKDIIIISAPGINEVFIIDHSTTTAQAASAEGGNYGFGGDFLYRWGNPKNYNHGDEEDQRLFFQHDITWIKEGLPDEGKLMVFNNRAMEDGELRSSVFVINPDTTALGDFALIDDKFGPEDEYWSYQLSAALTSNILSSAQRLPNGNTAICSGRIGHITEINEAKEIVWDYRLPISNDGPITQGAEDSPQFLFNTIRYSINNPAFAGKDLTPGEKIELEPVDNCTIYNDDSGLAENPVNFMIYPNPSSGNVTLEFHSLPEEITIFDLNGKMVFQSVEPKGLTVQIDLTYLTKGVYIFRLINKNGAQNKRFVLN